MKKVCLLVIFTFLLSYFSNAQQWLNFANYRTGTEWVKVGNLNVTGHNITVEALITKTIADTTTMVQQDVVSKHLDAVDVNYLLRDWCFIMCTTSGKAVIENPIHLSINVPYHIAATYDGDSVKYYVNGCKVNSMHFTGDMLQNNYQCAIGNRAWPRNEKFPGYIDEVRIWNVTRTPLEIAFNMNTLPSPTTQTGLLAYYDFNGNYKNVQGNAAWNGVIQGIVDIGSNPFWHDSVENICGLTIANFTASRKQLCTGNCTNFFDMSTGATSWQWSFAGGTPAVSTIKNPAFICYDTPGLYDVSLVIANSASADSITYTGLIEVNDPPPTPVINLTGNKLYINSDSSYISYLWFNDTLLIPGATDTSIAITKGGNYKVVVTDKNGCVASADYSSGLGILNPLTHNHENAFIMYPNPATTFLNIKQIWGKAAAGRIEIYTMLGEVVKSEKVKPFKEMTVAIDNLPKGSYLLKLTFDSGKWLGRFVKE